MSGIKLTINLNESIKKKLCFKRECLNYFLLLVRDLCTNIYIGYKMNFQLFRARLLDVFKNRKLLFKNIYKNTCR